MLLSGVHVVTRRSGRKAYYYRPHRGTAKAAVSIRLPDNPQSPEFWKALEVAQGNAAAPEGGMARMIDAYLASPRFNGLAKASKKDYRRYLDDLKNRLGKFETDAIEPRHIAKLRDLFGATPSKANHYVAVVRAVYSWGIELGHARFNPAENISSLKTGDGHLPWPTWAWEMSLTMRDECRIACALALYTGQRLGDVLRMQLGHIEDGIVAVRQGKTGKAMRIPLHRELLPVIEECRKRGSIYLVAKPDGSPFSTDHFQAMWTREMKKEPQARIRREGYAFHGLRKSATVKLLEAGATEKETSAVTGMSLPMVEHYSRMADQLRLAKEAIRKVEGA
jgi:integrase